VIKRMFFAHKKEMLFFKISFLKQLASTIEEVERVDDLILSPNSAKKTSDKCPFWFFGFFFRVKNAFQKRNILFALSHSVL
jgi:hypothetical protein